jgi:hypothetical protein
VEARGRRRPHGSGGGRMLGLGLESSGEMSASRLCASWDGIGAGVAVNNVSRLS